MADGITQAVFGDEAARRYEAQPQTSAAANAFDRLVQAGATSSMVGADIDGVKQGQAMQAADSASLRDAQLKNAYTEELRRMQSLEEERARVNQAYDEELARSSERLQNDYGLTGL